MRVCTYWRNMTQDDPKKSNRRGLLLALTLFLSPRLHLLNAFCIFILLVDRRHTDTHRLVHLSVDLILIADKLAAEKDDKSGIHHHVRFVLL